jgi:hypothetical protein
MAVFCFQALFSPAAGNAHRWPAVERKSGNNRRRRHMDWWLIWNGLLVVHLM